MSRSPRPLAGAAADAYNRDRPSSSIAPSCAKGCAVLTVSRLLTLRLCLVGVFALAFACGGPWGTTVAAVSILLMEGVRQAESRLARRQPANASEARILLAPLADSAYRLTVALCFLSAGFASLWVVVVIAYVTLLVAAVRTPGVASPASGRAPVLTRIAVFTWALVPLAVLWRMRRLSPIDPFALEAAQRLGRSLMLVALAVTVAWGLVFVLRNRRALADMMRRTT